MSDSMVLQRTEETAADVVAEYWERVGQITADAAVRLPDEASRFRTIGRVAGRALDSLGDNKRLTPTATVGTVRSSHATPARRH